MSDNQIRNELLQYLKDADSGLLAHLLQSAKDYSSEIVGYNADGSPISREQYIQEAKEASQRVNEGDFIYHKDIDREINE